MNEYERWAKENGLYRIFKDQNGKILKIIIKDDNKFIEFVPKEEIIIG